MPSLSFLRVARLWGIGGGAGWMKCPRPITDYRTINDNEMKFVSEVENH